MLCNTLSLKYLHFVMQENSIYFKCMFTTHVTGIGYILATPSKVTLQEFEDCLLHTRNYKYLSYAQHSYTCMHIHTSRLYSRLYTIKHSGGKLFQSINNIHYVGKFLWFALDYIFYCSNLQSRKISVVKHLQLVKICENREGFPWNILSLLFGSRKYKLYYSKLSYSLCIFYIHMQS